MVEFAQVELMVVPETTGFPLGRTYEPELFRKAHAARSEMTPPRTLPSKIRTKAGSDLRMMGKVDPRCGVCSH
jgi:hypothetical protein